MQLLTCLFQRQRKLGGYINPPLATCVLLIKVTIPKTSTYVKSYGGQTKCMYILIEDDDFFV